MLLLQAERQLLMTIPDTKRHIFFFFFFLLQSFVFLLGSLSGERSRVQPTRQIAMSGEQRRKHVHEARACVNVPSPVTTHFNTHPWPSLKKSELWKENFVLLKPKFRRQIDALLPHFHSQTPTDTISLAPKVWSPPLPSLSSLCFKGNFEDCESRFRWPPSGLLPQCWSHSSTLQKTGAFQDMKFFFSFFFCFFFFFFF